MKINYFIMLANRRLNSKFNEKTILRHQDKWMKALYSRYENN